VNRSQLIEILAEKQPHLDYRGVELAVKAMLEHMSQALASGGRIEIRIFGSFTLHYLRYKSSTGRWAHSPRRVTTMPEALTKKRRASASRS